MSNPQDHGKDAVFQSCVSSSSWSWFFVFVFFFLVLQSSQPPETLLSEFLDSSFGAGAAHCGGDRRRFGQGWRRHIILPLQGFYNPLETSLLLSKIMLHTGEERGIERIAEGGKEEAWFRGCATSRQIYLYSSFSPKRDKMHGCGGRRWEKGCEEDLHSAEQRERLGDEGKDEQRSFSDIYM